MLSSSCSSEGSLPRGLVVSETPSDSRYPQATRSPAPSPNTQGKRTAIFIQDECLKHRFIRSRDVSGIFERPERLHALKLGLSAAISRIEEAEFVHQNPSERVATGSSSTEEGDLANALARMAITPPVGPAASSSSSPLHTASVSIRRTSTSVSLLDHAAVKYIHGDIDGDVYLEDLISWARDSQKNIAKRGTEIPEGIPPLDLYLCPGSIDAIQGAIGAVCEAVDASVAATRGPQPVPRGLDGPCERAFVAVRPPGHHCGEDTPSGFCFINNVAVGAAHAHLNHGIQRIVILDIDLHHGNGTQSIVWQINEETYRQTLDSESGLPPAKPGPRVFYGSLHDILSFPCEDGIPEMVQAASTSIHGPHGQYIENIHLERYDSEAHFWAVLYPRYLALLHRARDFLDETGGPGDDVIVFISCGFDAGEHEYSSMSRHDRKVPVGFYHRFTRATCTLANVYAHGRVVSVLEGGYSDRALTSGAMGHLCGLVDGPGRSVTSGDHFDSSEGWVDEKWWSEANLVKLEKAVKPRKSASARASMEQWLVRTLGLFSFLNGSMPDSTKASGVGAGTDASTSMTLRERKKSPPNISRAGGMMPDSAGRVKHVSRSVSTPAKSATSVHRNRATSAGISTLKSESGSGPGPGELGRGEGDRREESGTEKKKLPRVILRVRSPDAAG